MLTLTACNDDDTGGGPAASVTQAAPAGSAAATTPDAVPTATPTTAGSKPATARTTGPAATSQVQMDSCGATGKPLAPGHRNILPTKRATATTIYATDADLVCTQPDFGWWPKGPEKAYTFAAGAKAQIAVDLEPQAVSLGKLAERLARCADDAADHLGCGSGAYEVTLDSAGKITAIREYADY